MNALANDLEAGFEILWYKIKSVLGRGGFGITYLAIDTNLDQLVAIKEYLPNDFATRSGDSTVQPASKEQEDMYSWGLERFMSEAQTLAKFRHPNIVRVQSVFKHNNTGYMVMEYEHGRPLYDIYKEKKQLSQKTLEAIYFPIMDGLAAVHQQGFIHRDIKPANIYIRDDGSPVLLDFGAARHAVGTHTRTLTSMLTVGYAPFEQYHEGSGKQGPWTDIYALCACLYEGIKGQKPMESAQRGMALLHDEIDPYIPLSLSDIEGYQHTFLRGIDQGLMIQIHDRPQTLESFMGMLKGEIKLPEIPPRGKPEKKVNFEKTVIRPVNRGFEGQAVNTGNNSAQVQQAADDDSILPTRIDTLHQEQTSATTVGSGLLADKKRKWLLIGLPVLTGLIIVIVTAVLWQSDDKRPATENIVSNPAPEVVVQNTRQDQLTRLLKQADELYLANNYINSGQDNALNRYLEVLSLDKQNKIATSRLNKIAQILLGEADELIRLNMFQDAASRLDAVSTINPAFPGLNPARKKLNESVLLAKNKEQLASLLDFGQQAMDKRHLYTPIEKSALEVYQRVLSIDPENSTARSNLKQISDQILSDAQLAIDKQQYDQANELVALAENFVPESPDLIQVKKNLLKIQQFNQLMARADAAYDEQRYTSPAKGSAVSLYREILTQYPSNRHAELQLTNIVNRYAQSIRDAIEAKNVKKAEYNLNILHKYFPQFADTQKLEKEVKNLKSSPSISRLIPAGINQSQDDDVVVEEIVGLFVRNFKNRNIGQLKQVSQLTKAQESLYNNLFNLYQHLDLKLVPQSYTVNKTRGLATAKLKISDLVDQKGRSVTTTANWTRLGLTIRKKEGAWLKAEVTNY